MSNEVADDFDNKADLYKLNKLPALPHSDNSVEILPGTVLSDNEKTHVIQKYEEGLGRTPTASECKDIVDNVLGPPITLAELAEKLGKSEEWVKAQIYTVPKPQLKLTLRERYWKFRQKWKAFWESPTGQFLDRAFWILLLILNCWIIGEGCGRTWEKEKWQKEAVERKYGNIDPDSKKFQWVDNAGQNAVNGGGQTD